MTWLVSLCGAVITLFASVGVVQPIRLIHFLQTAWQTPKGLFLAIAIRMVLGALLLATASESRFPQVFQILGGISVAAAAISPLIGFARLNRFVQWWAKRPTVLVRIWSLGAVGFGVFLIYGVS
jgi:hypothetical protein